MKSGCYKVPHDLSCNSFITDTNLHILLEPMMRIGNKTFKRLFREQLTNDRNLCCAKIETKEIEEQKMNFEK